MALFTCGSMQQMGIFPIQLLGSHAKMPAEIQRSTKGFMARLQCKNLWLAFSPMTSRLAQGFKKSWLASNPENNSARPESPTSRIGLGVGTSGNARTREALEKLGSLGLLGSPRFPGSPRNTLGSPKIYLKNQVFGTISTERFNFAFKLD